MKQVKKVEPVSYKKSIMAAFDRQKKGKTCPICSIHLSLAAYREHLDNCSFEDDDCQVVASYTKEEAILLRAGPEIVIPDEDTDCPGDLTSIPDDQHANNSLPSKNVTIDKPEIEEQENIGRNRKRKKSDDRLEEPSHSPNAPRPNTNIVIKESPVWENRRRSARIREKHSENSVKLEIPKLPDIVKDLEKLENYFSSTSEDQQNDAIPYFVKFSIRIIKRVLTTRKNDGTYYDEAFWTVEDIRKIHQFVAYLTNSARYLAIRLFLKRPGWYNMEKLKEKYSDIPNLESAATMLIRCNFLEDGSCLQELDEALNLADVTTLKVVAKQFKMSNSQGRMELIKSIKMFATSQKSIFGENANISSSILRCLKKNIGMCVRIKEEFCDLLKSIFTLYCPTSTNSVTIIENPKANVYQEMLYLMLQVENRSVIFPAPNPCSNIISIYRNRNDLFNYVSAKNREMAILNKMSAGGFETAFELALCAKDLVDEQPDDDIQYYGNLSVNERKFTSRYVLVRCCGHGATILEKMKKYGMAVEWQTYLLRTEGLKPFCGDMRGVWWDRMLLNLDSHIKDKNECIKMINLALSDEHILEKELLMIQDRASRLLKDEFVPKIIISDPEKKIISSRILSKDLGDGRVNRFIIRNSSDEDVECSVEEVVRQYYFENEGFTHGFHDEGASWHTLFGIIFYELIFDASRYPDVWLSELQDSPTDLSNSLYLRRKSDFDEKFRWLKEAEDHEISEHIRKGWNKYEHITNRECAWRIFSEGVQGCLEMFECISRSSLLAIFQRLAENYRNCRSGFPDLTLFNPKTKKITVVEVKGPGDRLSTKQRLWLDYFNKNGIDAVVCHVKAENEKRL